jgi:hypothetical protein
LFNSPNVSRTTGTAVCAFDDGNTAAAASLAVVTAAAAVALAVVAEVLKSVDMSGLVKALFEFQRLIDETSLRSNLFFSQICIGDEKNAVYDELFF